MKYKIIFFGNGLKKCIKNILLKNKNTYFINNILPSANNIGILAYKKFKKNRFEKTVSFEPFYL